MSLPQEPALRRTLGLADVALFFVVAGSNLQWVATAAAAGPSSLPMWILGCATMFVPLSICVIYLTSKYPDEGGMYVWSKRAFGPFAGFFTGWTYWTSNLPYFPALLYFAAGNALYFGNWNRALGSSPGYFIAFALLGLAFATMLNVYGFSVARWLNNAGAWSRWLITLALIGIGCIVWSKFGAATSITWQTMQPQASLKNAIFWSVIAFAWTGPEAMSFIAGEVRQPRRSIPLGLAIAAPAIAVIYILGTVAVLAALPSHSVDSSAGVMQAISSAALRLNSQWIVPVASLLVVISCLGSCGAWLGAVGRIPFVAGIDRYLPKAFGTLHPRWGSPVVALLSQSAIAAVFVVLGQLHSSVHGAYDVLVSSTVLITMLPFVLLFASAIKLRGGPWIVLCAVVGLVTTVAAIGFALIPAPDDPDKVLSVAKVLFLTVALAGAGIVVYWFGRRRISNA
ncbi:MAG TPA: APC family permease [Candidatus Tumulicola sp.]